MFKEGSIQKVSLWLLNLSGQHPQYDNLRTRLVWGSYTICVIIMFILITVEMVTKPNDIDTVASSLEALITLYQMSIKTAMIVVCKEKLAKLLDEMKNKFWTLETINAEDDEKLKKETEFLKKLAWLWSASYRNGGCVLFSTFVIKSVYNRTMPLMTCWLPKDDTIPYTEIMYCMQLYVVFMLIPFVAGYDTLFAAYCVPLAVQFKILCRAFEKAVPTDVDASNAEEIFNKNIKKCILHHQFLRRYGEDLRKMYSAVLLNQYAMSIITLCMEIYITTERTSNLGLFISSGIYLIQAMVELGLYCMAVTVLGIESGKIVHAIYSSNWYNLPRKSVLQNLEFVTTNSQKPVLLEAGGLFPLDCSYFVTVLNAAFSYYTLMKRMKNLQLRGTDRS